MMRFWRSRAGDWMEFWVGYGLILAVIWTPQPAQRVLYWMALVWIIVTAVLRRKQTRPNGFGLKGLLGSSWVVPVAAALFFIGLETAARMHSLHRLYGPLPVLAHMFEYAIWAIMQQFIVQVYVLLRFIRLGMRRRWAVALSAILFATAHIPNPVLVPAVLIWGAMSCMIYLRWRNLYTLALAHAMLGMCLAITVPNSICHHMRVGLGYVTYPDGRTGLDPTSR